MQVTYNRLLVLPDAAESKTPGGILLPDTAKKTSHRGTIISAGPGQHEHGVFVSMQFKTGQKIIYSEYSGTKLTEAGVEYLVIRETDVVAVLDETPAA